MNTEFILVRQEGGFAPASTQDAGSPGAQNGAGDGTTGTANQTAPSPGGGGGWMILVLMFVFVYFFLIRPERKRQRAAAELRSALKKGDKVVTAGGMHASVAALDDHTVTLKVDDGTRIKFDRNSIVRVASDPKEKAEEAVKS